MYKKITAINLSLTFDEVQRIRTDFVRTIARKMSENILIILDELLILYRTMHPESLPEGYDNMLQMVRENKHDSIMQKQYQELVNKYYSHFSTIQFLKLLENLDYKPKNYEDLTHQEKIIMETVLFIVKGLFHTLKSKLSFDRPPLYPQKYELELFPEIIEQVKQAFLFLSNLPEFSIRRMSDLANSEVALTEKHKHPNPIHNLGIETSAFHSYILKSILSWVPTTKEVFKAKFKLNNSEASNIWDTVLQRYNKRIGILELPEFMPSSVSEQIPIETTRDLFDFLENNRKRKFEDDNFLIAMTAFGYEYRSLLLIINDTIQFLDEYLHKNGENSEIRLFQEKLQTILPLLPSPEHMYGLIEKLKQRNFVADDELFAKFYNHLETLGKILKDILKEIDGWKDKPDSVLYKLATENTAIDL